MLGKGALKKRQEEILSSILCVVPHKPLFEGMKQPHETVQDKSGELKQKSTSSYSVYRGYCGLQRNSGSPVLCVNSILCVSPPSRSNTHSVGHQKPSDKHLPIRLPDVNAAEQQKKKKETKRKL